MSGKVCSARQQLMIAALADCFPLRLHHNIILEADHQWVGKCMHGAPGITMRMHLSSLARPRRSLQHLEHFVHAPLLAPRVLSGRVEPVFVVLLEAGRTGKGWLSVEGWRLGRKRHCVLDTCTKI